MAYNTRLLIALSLIYAVHLCLKFNSISVPVFLSSYLADLLCLPFILSFFVLIVRFLKRQETFQLSLPMIAFGVIYISFVFEYWLPHYYPKHTADPMDVVFYALGGVFYFLFQNREMKKFSAEKATGVQ